MEASHPSVAKNEFQEAWREEQAREVPRMQKSSRVRETRGRVIVVFSIKY